MAPPRRSTASYTNGILAVLIYGGLAYGAWYMPYVWLLSVPLGFFSMLQVFGLVMEYMGNDIQQNPRTGEWSKME
jgi:hypothetical protein